MSDTLKDMIERRSIRKYKPDSVPDDLIEKIINAGLYAASSRGQQKPVLIAVTNKQVRDSLSDDNRKIGGWDEGFDPFYGAPALIMVVCEKAHANKVYDGSCVMENLMIAAHACGLGSCWIHRAKEELEMPKWQQWLKDLGLEGEYEGIGHCILGYTDGEYPAPPERKTGRVFYVK